MSSRFQKSQSVWPPPQKNTDWGKIGSRKAVLRSGRLWPVMSPPPFPPEGDGTDTPEAWAHAIEALARAHSGRSTLLEAKGESPS